VVLKATDPAGEEVRLSFSLEVRNDPPAGSGWGSGGIHPLTYTQIGFYIDRPIPPAVDPEGQTVTYTLIGSLPFGLSFNTATGGVSGTPTAVAGDYQWTVRASDPHGASVEQRFSIRLYNMAPVFTPPSNPPSTLENSHLDVGLSAFFHDANNEPLTYTLLSGPSWLTVSGSVLSGDAPSVNSLQGYSVTIVATDRSGASTTGTFSVRVYDDGNGGGGPPLPQSIPMEVAETDKASTLSPSGEGFASGAVSASAALLPLTDVLAGWRPTDTAGLRSYRYYDGQGRTTGTVDERGFLSETVYDAYGNSQQELRYLGALTVNAATDTLATLRLRAGASRSTTTSYDGFGRVSTQTAMDGSVSRNIYDSAGRLARQVWAEGTSEQRASRTRYNAFDEATGILGGVGDATLGATPTQAQIDAAIATYGMRYEYDSFGRRVKATDANNNPSWFYYDSEGRLSHTVNALGEVSATVYNRFGQIESIRRYANRLTTANLATLTGGFATDAFRALLVPSATLDQETAYEYDTRGLLTRQTDAEGFVTTSEYTQYGQLARQIRAISTGRTTATQFGYDLRGMLIAQTGDAGGINLNSRTVYDAYGRVVRSIDGAGKVVKTDYSDNGRTVVVTDPLNRTMRTEYDAFSRVWKTVDGDGQATTYAYDEAARSVAVITPEGITITTFRSRHGETVKLVDGRGGITKYEYDKNGALKQIKDALDQVVTDNTHDASGRLIETKDARGTVVKLTYDAVNRAIERQVDPTGLNLRTQYLFDAFGQQVRMTEGVNTPAQRMTTYAYDRKGQLVRIVVDPNGLRLSTRYTFDGLGNTVKVEQGTLAAPAQQVTRYEFDNLGRRTRTIVAPTDVFGAGAPGMRDLTTEYRYDVTGRLSRTIDALGQSTWYVYNAAGQQVQSVNALGEVTETGYDSDGRVVHVRHYYARVDQTALNGFGDAIGPVTVAASSRDQRSYQVYDKDGRQRYQLQAVSSDAWAIAETIYDANGNAVETRRYEKRLSDPRVIAIEAEGIAAAEVAGELTRPTNDPVPGLGYIDEASLSATQRTRYAYDANNRLRFTVDALGGVSETVYDAGGLAVAQIRFATAPTLSAHTEQAIDAAVSRTDPMNRTTRFSYDAAGRLRYTLQVLASDAQGKATQHLTTRQEYDALGRVVMSTAYATVLGVVADYKAATLDAAVRVSAQDRRSAAVYDVAGRQVYSAQVSAIAANGNATKHIVRRNDYDALGRVVKTTAYAAETGAIATYTLAGVGAAVTASTQDRTNEMVYDAAGRQRFVIAADGNVSETVYDALGRVKEQRQFAFVVDKATAWTETTLETRRGGRVVGDGTTRGEKYDYDRANRVLSTTDALGKTESWTYDALGEKQTYTNKNGAQWTYVYDRLGRLTLEETSPYVYQLSNETTPGAARTLKTLLDYDAFGNLTGRREAYGTVDERTTKFEYDRLGRQIKTTEPGWYDPATGRVEKTQATGRFQRTTEVMYDTLGDAVRNKVRTGAGSHQYDYKTYDMLGRVVHEVDALNNVTTQGYTTFGESATVTRQSVVLSATAPLRGYWTAAEVATEMAGDALARATGNTYDNLGRLIETRGPTGSSYYFSGNTASTNAGSIVPIAGSEMTKYEYTVFGQLHREAVQIDATRWNETWHYYDAMGREIRSIDALGHHTARGYDTLGNLIETVEYATVGASGTSGQHLPPPLPAQHADDRILAYVHDARNQQIEVQRRNLRYMQWNGSSYVQMTVGRDTAMTVQRMAYDNVGNATSHIDAFGNTTSTSYDAVGRVIQVVEPVRTSAGSGVDPFRDHAAATPVTTMTMDAFGRVVTRSRIAGGSAGGTLTLKTSYDIAGNVIGTIDARGNLISRQYDYAGRVIRETQAVDVQLGTWARETHTIERRFAYDALGRQTAAVDVYKDGATSMQSGQRNVYNAFGEVTEEQRIWGLATVSIASLSGVKAVSYTYNRAGQLDTRIAGDGETRFYYNLAGQTTRQEQRGDSTAVAPMRITETAYDTLGRASIQRLPWFDAILVPNGDAALAVTPYVKLRYDRWNNVLGRSQGGYVLNATGQVVVSDEREVKYEYNADNRLIRERLPTATAWREDGTWYEASRTHEMRYDLMGRVVQEVDLADDAATVTDERQLLRERIRRYDAVGQLTSETDGTGVIVEYAYDGHGRRVGTRNGVGTVFVDSFDANGNQTGRAVLRMADDTAYTGVNGQVPVLRLLQRYEYDQANRRVAVADVMDIAGQYNFWSHSRIDERGLVRATRNASGVLKSFGYDALGNRVMESDRSGEWDTVYSASAWTYEMSQDYRIGRLASLTVGSGRTTTYEYDGFGRLERENHPAGAGSREYAYHANGSIRQIRDTQERGTEGSVGGMDYLRKIEVMEYGYTTTGGRAREYARVEIRQDAGVYEYDQNTGEPNLVDIIAVDSLDERLSRISYDALGRVVKIDAPDMGNVNRSILTGLSYRYDALDNRMTVFARYQLSRYAGEVTNQKSYRYDHEGRMTSEIELNAGTLKSSVTLTYDMAGRRSSAEHWLRNTTYTVGERTGPVTEYHEEAYAYNDLGHLVNVRQRVNIQWHGDEFRDTGVYRDFVKRTHDVRGNLVRAEQYSKLSPVDQYGQPILLTVTQNSYRDDGLLRTQAITNERDQKTSAYIANAYDDAGNLMSYTYRQGKNFFTTEGFIHAYAFTYTTEFGGYKEILQTVTSDQPGLDPGDTVSEYDLRGQLIAQTIDEQNAVRRRYFTYDGEGRILTRNDAAGNIYKKQDYVYAVGQQVASIGNLSAVKFNGGYTPVSQVYASPTAGSHVVNPGDSLQSIASTVYGDSQLWYVIADANGLNFGPADALPTTEMGRTYRIPQIAAGRNNATTFEPYNPGRIIGDSTPSPTLTPNASNCTPVGRVLLDAIIIAVSNTLQYGMTIVLTAAGVPAPMAGAIGGAVGGMAGDAMQQGAAIALGEQDGFDLNRMI
jgi:YD repeat-containing protein